MAASLVGSCQYDLGITPTYWLVYFPLAQVIVSVWYFPSLQSSSKNDTIKERHSTPTPKTHVCSLLSVEPDSGLW